MNGKELFLGLSYISRKYIDEAETDTVSGNAKGSVFLIFQRSFAIMNEHHHNIHKNIFRRTALSE